MPSDKARLADAMGARLRADRLADGDEPEAIEKDVANSRSRITSAPAVIVACFTLVRHGSLSPMRGAPRPSG